MHNRDGSSTIHGMKHEINQNEDAARTFAAAILAEESWYYAIIQYNGRMMGLLVHTADRDEAWQEAATLCSGLGDRAKLRDVRKVVIQGRDSMTDFEREIMTPMRICHSRTSRSDR